MKVRVHGRAKHFRTVSFDSRTNEVVLIEQRRLPHAFKLVRTRNFKQTARAITNMTVRGAGAIGQLRLMVLHREFGPSQEKQRVPLLST